MEIILVFFVLACVWFLFVGLPVLGLYYMMKGQRHQELEDQRRQFERLLRDVEKRTNKQEPETASSARASGKPKPLKTVYFSETSLESEFHLQPPVVAGTNSNNSPDPPVLPEETISQQTDSTDSTVSTVEEVLPPVFQASDVLPQVEPPKEVVKPEPKKETASPVIPTETDNNIIDNNIYGIRADHSRRPVPVGALSAQATQEPSKPSASRPYGFEQRVEEKTKTGEVPADELTSLELQIGRKLLGWIAVGLFVLAGAFFVQLAISRGWLNPLNRFVGMVLTGSAILVYGRHLFRIGWRRYSEMINSAGIVTLFSAAYYAKFVGLFSPTISGGLLVATILGGFLLSAVYRSMIVGYVATFGGLIIPLLIQLGPDSFGLVFYLSILNLAVIMLINLLGRSHLALISWVGTPILMIYFWERNGHTIQYAQSGLLFYSIFFVLYLVDTFLAVSRTSRRIGTNDVVRALLTPVIFFGGCRTVLLKTENLVLCNLSGKAFFDQFGSWVALGLAVIALIAALVSARRSKRPDMVPDRNAVMTGVLSVVVFLFLGMFIPLALKSSAVAVGWLAIAVGLLAMSTKRYRLFFFASVPNDPEKLARRGSEPTDQLQQFETGYFQFWSFIFFMLGTSRLILSDFLPNWAPVHAFRGGSFVFIHPLAVPVTCGCALLVAGMIFVLYRVKKLSSDTVTKTDTSANSQPVHSSLAVVYGVVGLLVFLLLTCSESYSWTVASSERWNWSSPELFGWSAVLYVLTGISLIAFVWGSVRHNIVVRASALGLLTLVGIKATLADVVFHPLITQQLPSVSRTGDLSTLSDHVFLIGNLQVPQYALPMINPFVLPLVVCAVVMMVVGIAIRKQRECTATDHEQFNNESTIGLSFGMWGLALLWILASLECAAWCEYRPEIYGVNSFYTAHVLIAFWTLVSCIILAIGAWSRSLAIRVFVYSTLLLQLPFVAWTEFCGKSWRPETIQWPLINWDALPVLAFSVFLMATGVWLTRVAREI
ncbi:MAG: DUF2339 domain-containing protein, partial [Planctomycetia bacterium]|nr:DUF2339 domain-containing protein [Planctomycetia bacterium]